MTTPYPPLYDGPENPGQRAPRRFTAMSWLSHPVIGKVFAEFNREVPSEFWNEDVEAARSIAVVACPCGSEPHVKLHSTEFCESCDRVFWYLGDKLLVARDPSRADEHDPSPGGRTLGSDDGGESPTEN